MQSMHFMQPGSTTILYGFHLGVDQDIRSARCRAVAALIAGIGNADLPGDKLVGEAEKSAVRTGVGAEAFLPKKTNGQEIHKWRETGWRLQRTEMSPKNPSSRDGW